MGVPVRSKAHDVQPTRGRAIASLLNRGLARGTG
jgi:hypothetical protein